MTQFKLNCTRKLCSRTRMMIFLCRLFWFQLVLNSIPKRRYCHFHRNFFEWWQVIHIHNHMVATAFMNLKFQHNQHLRCVIHPLYKLTTKSKLLLGVATFNSITIIKYKQTLFVLQKCSLPYSILNQENHNQIWQLTTTSKPKIVRPRFLMSHFAASVTKPWSMRSLLPFEQLPSPEFWFPVAVGRDFKLQKKINRVLVSKTCSGAQLSKAKTNRRRRRKQGSKLMLPVKH